MKMKVKNYLFSSFDIIMQTKFLGINCSLGGSNLEGLYCIVWVQLLGCCDVRNNIDIYMFLDFLNEVKEYFFCIFWL